MEFLVSIFEIVKNLGEATGKWFGYINSLDANLKIFKRKIEDLSSQEDDIKTELSSAEQQSGKRRKKVVQDWLGDVQMSRGDMRTLQRQEQEVVGWKNVFSRVQLGKLVVEKIQEVAELQEKVKFSNGLLIEALPTSGLFIPTMGSFCENTSARNMENVWKYLMDDEVRRIGIFGMGGIGKTTFMHHINNELLNEACNFDDVIWVTVSKAFNIRNLQRQIAKALNLDLSSYGDETKRASELYTMLFEKKRYVLILDDLWKAFPLDKAGIPKPSISNECKLVLTTQLLEVCRKMKCRAVKVELLTEDEALNLFMSKVEEHQTVLTPKVKEITTKVAKECARLSLAIITIADSMRGVNDIRGWRNAVNELTSSTKQIRDNESVIFERLKFSYSRLNEEKLQHCFLYCALYPEDNIIPREELIEYWIAEGLMAEMNSIEAMFDKGFMAKAGEGLGGVAYEDWSEDLERVSLMYNKIEELPFRPPICPRLTTLLLGYNPLLRIPNSFFAHMHHLNVLDLSGTYIESMPDSISKLVNLHTLLLKDCVRLKYVPSLEKLKALKELKLKRSQIEEVPQGIE
ncbi:disease resistance protein At4g27190-like [Camellia sinensis]|uniref:disease resistance protein At4g27190-like n=1 Tax=Camellia sinensis TaxID=4442 RepID=UPI00103682D6|nr:disease resistance protein At4g27190-like [Camellia sinensis]